MIAIQAGAARLSAVTTVLIADDDHLMRAGLAAVLESDETIQVIGQASTGREAIALTRRREPDVVLMDVEMPDLDGIAATRELAGAATPAEELIRAVHTVAAGESLLSPSVTRRVIDGMAHPGPQPGASNLDSLTPREGEVLVLLASGLSNAEIAGELIIEESTVETHVKRILMKLGLRDRVQAVIFAYEHGIATPG